MLRRRGRGRGRPRGPLVAAGGPAAGRGRYPDPLVWPGAGPGAGGRAIGPDPGGRLDAGAPVAPLAHRRPSPQSQPLVLGAARAGLIRCPGTSGALETFTRGCRIAYVYWKDIKALF